MSSASRSVEQLQNLDIWYSPRVSFRRCRERVEKRSKEGRCVVFLQKNRTLTVGERGGGRRGNHLACKLNGLIGKAGHPDQISSQAVIMPNCPIPVVINPGQINTTRRRMIDT